jgi:thioredoxin-related protein
MEAQEMKRLTLALSGLAFALANAVSAAELVMVEETSCHWCDRWNEEIGVVYHKTEEGKRAPLRRVDISDPIPKDLTFKSRANYTPTFILIEDGKEFGRIEGYPGEDFFWPMLGQLLDNLPEGAASGS